MRRNVARGNVTRRRRCPKADIFCLSLELPRDVVVVSTDECGQTR